jgi:Glycosyl transferase family 2
MNEKLITFLLPVGDNRPTIFETIHSVIAANDQRVQIIISDNTLQESELMKLSTGLPSVKYFKQQTRLSMAENWQFLLDQVDTEWFTFIGADDGVISEHLGHFLDFLGESETEIVATHRVYFSQNSKESNEIRIPSTSCTNRKEKFRLNTLLRAIFHHRFSELPMPYNSSAVNANLLKPELTRLTELPGVAPDYFLAAYFSFLAKTALYYDYPIFIHGSSEFSNGLQLESGIDNKTTREFLTSVEHSRHSVFKDIHQTCAPAMTLESWMLAKEIATSKKKFQGKYIKKISLLWVSIQCTTCPTHRDPTQKNPNYSRLVVKIANIVFRIAKDRFKPHQDKVLSINAEDRITNFKSFLSGA